MLTRTTCGVSADTVFDACLELSYSVSAAALVNKSSSRNDPVSSTLPLVLRVHWASCYVRLEPGIAGNVRSERV